MEKKRFKLYKSGKKWLTSAIAVTAFTAGVYSATNVASAATEGNDPATGLTAGENTQTDSSASGSDSQSAATSSSATSGSNTPATPESGSSNPASQFADPSNDAPANSGSNSGEEKSGAPADNGGSAASSAAGKSKNTVVYHDAGWTKIETTTNGETTTTWAYNNPTWEGEVYVNLNTIPVDGNSTGTHWYLMNGNQVLSGVQAWAGTYYYFDLKTYTRVDNNYV